MATQLRRELLELDIISASQPPARETPAGAKGAGGELGELIVTLARAPGLLAAVVKTVQSWLSGLGRRSVRLELDGDVLEVTAVSSRQQQELIQVWIQRHAVG